MTQKEAILDYLQTYSSLTSKEAMEFFGCMRLAATIHRLKKEGHTITGEQSVVKNRYNQTTHITRYHYHYKDSLDAAEQNTSKELPVL